jgi:trimeric autotransporter adhesin
MKSAKWTMCGAVLLIISATAVWSQQNANGAGSPPTASTSQLPRLVRFGGTLKDVNDNPLTGITGVTFSLYSEQAGGSPLWLETQNVQPDKNGHYTVQLGSTKPDGLPVDLFTSEQARWVGVQVSGQAEQPRVLVVSAPYALKAGDAETLGGKPASAYALATPQTATSAPANEGAKANAAISASNNNQSSIQAAITGSGATNYIPRWTSSTALGNSNIFQNATNKDIGIGTATPTATLDVKGNVVFTGNQTVNGLLTVHGGTASVATATFNSAGGYILEGRSKGANEFNLDGAGNLFANGSLFTNGGIANDGFAVDSKGNLSTTGSVSANAGSFAGNGISTVVGDPGCGSGYAGIGFGAMSACTSYSLVGDGTNTYLNSTSNGSIHLRNNNNELMTVNSSGAMNVLGNASQNLGSAGFVKAMVYYHPAQSPPIVRCYNSQLAGAAASTPPCGITISFPLGGDDPFFDLGFEVDNRFVTVTAVSPADQNPASVTLYPYNTSNTQLRFEETDIYGNPINVPLYVFIY